MYLITKYGFYHNPNFAIVKRVKEANDIGKKIDAISLEVCPLGKAPEKIKIIDTNDLSFADAEMLIFTIRDDIRNMISTKEIIDINDLIDNVAIEKDNIIEDKKQK